jgi:hypothetical protein
MGKLDKYRDNMLESLGVSRSRTDLPPRVTPAQLRDPTEVERGLDERLRDEEHPPRTSRSRAAVSRREAVAEGLRRDKLRSVVREEGVAGRRRAEYRAGALVFTVAGPVEDAAALRAAWRRGTRSARG